MLWLRWGLDDRRHQGAILVGLDLEGDGLGEHQVVVCLPSLFGLALAILCKLFKPLLDLQELVELDGRLFSLFKGCLNHLSGLDREVATVNESLALQDDLVHQTPKVRSYCASRRRSGGCRTPGDIP